MMKVIYVVLFTVSTNLLIVFTFLVQTKHLLKLLALLTKVALVLCVVVFENVNSENSFEWLLRHLKLYIWYTKFTSIYIIQLDLKYQTLQQQIILKMDDRQEKQVYLRQNILQKNYDAEEFIMFLNNKLSIGDNLDLCSLSELQAVVDQFISLKEQQKQKQFQPITSMIESAVEIPQNESKVSLKPKKILFTKYNPHLLETQYLKTYQCKKVIDKYNHLKSIKCLVSDPERKNTGGVFGIGGTSFLEFKVQTVELGWKVGRRYSDFVWLRTYLLKAYPSFIIPPVPEKKASKKTQRHLEKRMRILQYFLNDLVSIPEIFNDKFVEGFLSLSDPIKFQNLKKEEQKTRQWQQISDSSDLDGKISVKLSEQNKVYLQEMQKKVKETQRIYKLITRSSKNLQNTFTQQVNNLYEMGNLFAELHQSTRQTLNKLPKCEPIKGMNDIYITLNNMMIEWGNIVRNQHAFLQKNFNTFFKYVRNQLYGFSELLVKEQEIQNQYAKLKINLEKKKEKIYNQHDPQKWDLSTKELSTLPKEIVHDKIRAFQIMLPKDTSVVQKQKNKLFFFINEHFEHGQKNMKRNIDRFCDNFKEFAIKIKVNNQQLGQMWSQMSSNFSGEGKKVQFVKEKPVEEKEGNELFDD